MEICVVNNGVTPNRNIVANRNGIMANQRCTTHTYTVANLNGSPQVSNEKAGLLSTNSIMISTTVDAK